jgi:hypothetical protein
MDVSLYSLFGVTIVLAVNQLLLRIAVFRESRTGFLSVQSLNITMSVFVLVLGLPGYDDQPAVSWVVGLLFLVHAGQNGRLQDKWERRRRERSVEERAELADSIRQALRRSESESPEE